MDINLTPTKLIDQLRAWFHPKDRSVFIAEDCFIDMDEQTKPSTNPAAGRNRLYPKAGNNWYVLDSAGTETLLGGGSGPPTHTHNSAVQGGTTLNLPAGSMYQIDGAYINYTNALFQHIPGLVGFWPMSSVQRSTGNAYDLSGQGRTLTYNGNPTYNIYNNIMPYIDLDGIGDFFSRADETDLDVLGTETWAALPGLTIGGWFWFNIAAGALAASEGLISKDTAAAGGRSYSIQRRQAGGANFRFLVSTDGTNIVSVDNQVLDSSQWYFLASRFTPSIELASFVYDIKTTNLVGVPASIFNSGTALNIGAFAGTLLLTGRASLCFLSANALPDALISMLFNQSRVLFGV